MEIEKVLEKLEELFRGWGLTPKDWILTAHYAMRLQGYKVELRKGHLNTFVNKDKLPWKIGEGYEIFPPRGSIWARQFSSWMRSTSFDTDLIIYGTKRMKRLIKDSAPYQLSNKKIIYLATMEGNLKSLDDYMVHCTEEETGVEKGIYLLGRIEDMKRAAGEKRDKKSVNLANKLLKKYQYLRTKSKIPQKVGKQLKGIVACQGKVRGKVKVILGKGDRIGKVSKGDILVTKMTSAKFVTILGKIKAIVTDDGGTLCHAAILSREFKIPCIVGTKVATRVFKDGDIVEVDANKGTIKKIS